MASFNFNKVILGGRLTADPELKSTASGVSVTSFTVAVNRRFQPKDSTEKQADFLNVTAWRQTAEFVCSHFRKASSICIVGSLQTRTWTDPQGQKRYATEIVADETYFVDSKADSGAAPAINPSSQYIPEQYANQMPASGFRDVSDDEEPLPF